MEAVATKAGFMLGVGDQVELTLPPVRPSGITAEEIPIEHSF